MASDRAGTRKRSAAQSFQDDAEIPNKNAKLGHYRTQNAVHNKPQPLNTNVSLLSGANIDSQPETKARSTPNGESAGADETAKAPQAKIRSSLTPLAPASPSRIAEPSPVTRADSVQTSDDATNFKRSNTVRQKNSLRDAVDSWISDLGATTSDQDSTGSTPGTAKLSAATSTSIRGIAEDGSYSPTHSTPTMPAEQEQSPQQGAVPSSAVSLGSMMEHKYLLRNTVRDMGSDALLILARLGVQELVSRSRGVQHSKTPELINDSYQGHRIAEKSAKEQSTDIKSMLDRLPLHSKRLRAHAIERVEACQNCWKAVGMRELIHHGPHNNATLRPNQAEHGAPIIVRDFAASHHGLIANSDRLPFSKRQRSTDGALCDSRNIIDVACFDKNLDKVEEAHAEGLLDSRGAYASSNLANSRHWLAAAHMAIHHSNVVAQGQHRDSPSVSSGSIEPQTTIGEATTGSGDTERGAAALSSHGLLTPGAALDGKLSNGNGKENITTSKRKAWSEPPTLKGSTVQPQKEPPGPGAHSDGSENADLETSAAPRDVQKPHDEFRGQQVSYDASGSTESPARDTRSDTRTPSNAVTALRAACERRDALTRHAIIQRQDFVGYKEALEQAAGRTSAAEEALKETEAVLGAASVKVEREQMRSELELERAQMHNEMQEQWAALGRAKRKRSEEEDEEGVLEESEKKRRRES